MSKLSFVMKFRPMFVGFITLIVCNFALFFKCFKYIVVYIVLDFAFYGHMF